MARPTEYKAAYAEGARKLALLGATDAEVADFFGVDVRTIYRWKNTYDEFCQSLKAGKEQADERVERSLYHKAVGYEQKAVKIFMPAGKDEPVYAEYIEKLAPDTTAAIFWLKNRRSQEWRDKQDVEHSGGVTYTIGEAVRKL
jgi:transposase